ncbi:helix-turn-helix transcriptional regulator [Streptomyces sp. CSDS2]|uniref:helix-turn-helix domain-containing protein n=1 Tax=Streptomyces sp. CSDS2 TaxID=3055051 RepID=UPI0025AF3C81|nr:helix-turn-helix transcriptional regulator [Streptomyces sp. CSDS2]MDN3265734.1 helix-turn-helix transcriptional regulator [Streptomyces sp. CSDS2]
MQPSECQPSAGRMLGDELRRHRERRGLTLKEAARAIRASISKMSRLERGQSPPKVRDVYDLARFYGLDERQMQDIDQLLAQTNNHQWYDQFADVTPDYLKRLIQLEGQASQITIFESQAIPGLLQTREYTEAIVRLVRRYATKDEVAGIVQLRRERRKHVLGRIRLIVFLDETVLDRRRGGNEVMRAQLEDLLHVAETNKVHVRLVEKHDVAPPFPITHLTFPDGQHSELVYVEQVRSAVYVTKKRTLDEYRKLLDDLHELALTKNESMERLKEAIERYGAH